LCWSGGKDSAWALRELRADPRFDVRGLISLVNEKNGRVIQHGVRHSLLQPQAEAVALPLRFLPLDPTASTTERNAALALGFGELRRREAACVAFGDLFSIKGRDRRQLVTAGSGLELLFPLWGRDTRALADAMLGAGLSAWVCSVDTDFLPADRVGRRFDAAFVAGLPTGVDPCGGDDEFTPSSNGLPVGSAACGSSRPAGSRRTTSHSSKWNAGTGAPMRVHMTSSVGLRGWTACVATWTATSPKT